MRTKILIVDDHALIRKGVLTLLAANHPDWEVQEAGNGVDALLTVGKFKPDIVVMDYHMPRLNGTQAASVITHKYPGTKILMISMDESGEFIMNAIQAGVLGILPKNSTEDELLDAIRVVRNGNHYIHHSVSESVSDCVDSYMKKVRYEKHRFSDLLTDREHEIISMLVKGHPMDEILENAAISRRTLETHKRNIFRKLNVHSTAELIRWAVRNGLIQY